MNKLNLSCVLAFCLILSSWALEKDVLENLKFRPKFPKFKPHEQRFFASVEGENTGANYETFYYETGIDKFGFTTEKKFKMRYLMNDSFVTEGFENPPIFFYAGNEGDVTGFADNTGVMFELGAEVGALVVFAEHRYYGESKINDNKDYKYLSAELALADYAEFLGYLKGPDGYPNCEESPVVVFGGSYGGMLASWMRIKYPSIVVGAWAASAPVAWFKNLTDCSSYNSKVYRDFKAAADMCPENILKSWSVINQYAQTESGRQKLTEAFDLCTPLEKYSDVEALFNELGSAWSSVAMVNYPYPTEFLQPLPAWPVSVMCDFLKDANLTDDELVTQIGAASKVYFNYYDQYPCFNLSEGDIGLDVNIWNYQACSEMVMPMCSVEGDSMFPPESWSMEEFEEECKEEFADVGIGFRPDWMITQYGARDIKAASNIIFSNGDLDPWQAGGVSDNMGNPSIYTFAMPNAAHHLDLRTSNPADPEGVKQVRAAEFLIVKRWIKDHYKGIIKRAQTKFPL